MFSERPIISQSVKFDSVLSVPFPELLASLLAPSQLEDKIGNIVDVYLPFVRDLEGIVSERVEVKDIVQKYVIEISCDSLLPLLQVLQSHVSKAFIVFKIYLLVPKNLCAIILSTIYLSPKNLGIKFELIWATENLGTNSSKNKQYITEPSVVYLP